MTSPLMTIEELRVELTAGEAIIPSLTLSLQQAEIIGVVGESGSGKTTMALACLGYTRPGSRIVSGRVVINNKELVPGSNRALR